MPMWRIEPPSPNRTNLADERYCSLLLRSSCAPTFRWREPVSEFAQARTILYRYKILAACTVVLLSLESWISNRASFATRDTRIAPRTGEPKNQHAAAYRGSLPRTLDRA